MTNYLCFSTHYSHCVRNKRYIGAAVPKIIRKTIVSSCPNVVMFLSKEKIGQKYEKSKKPFHNDENKTGYLYAQIASQLEESVFHHQFTLMNYMGISQNVPKIDSFR